MAPCISTHYPLTKGLLTSTLLSNAKNGFIPSLDSFATLAQFSSKHMDSFLKEVTHYLKDPFQIFPEIIGSTELAVRVSSALGSSYLKWEFPSQALLSNQHPSMLQALEILSQALIQSHAMDQVVKQLASLEPEIRAHQTDMYFLLGFLEENDRYTGSLKDKSSMAAKLLEMGFTEHRSVVVADWISQQPFPEHQSLVTWAQEYITNLFMYDVFLNDEVPNYPYQEQKKDVWFCESIERDQENEGEGDENDAQQNNNKSVKLMNTCEEKVAAYTDELIKDIELEEQDQIYYHGTNHAGAQSILENSIDLGKGKPGCDFSSGDGFYLTNRSDYAIDWTKKFKARRALLVFYVKRNHLDKFKGLDLNSRHDDWKKVTAYYHHGKKGKLPLKGLNKYPYIEGPLSRDGTKKYPDAEQLCIRDKALAKHFSETGNICGALFF